MRSMSVHESVPAPVQPAGRSPLLPLWLTLGGLAIVVLAFFSGAAATVGIITVSHSLHTIEHRLQLHDLRGAPGERNFGQGGDRGGSPSGDGTGGTPDGRMFSDGS